VAFHGKDLSLKEWIKSASETLHTRSNLWSNRSPFRSFRWRKTNHAKPPQSTVCCPKPQHQTQAMAIYSAFSCQYLPTLCFNSIQQMLLNSQASSTHTVGIPRIPVHWQVKQNKAKASRAGTALSTCSVRSPTRQLSIYNCTHGTNIPATAWFVLLEARVCRESLCAPISCVPLTDWSSSSAVVAWPPGRDPHSLQRASSVPRTPASLLDWTSDAEEFPVLWMAVQALLRLWSLMKVCV